VGRGVIKLLILDRGFIDGKNISRCKHEWGIDVLLPMKKKMAPVRCTVWFAVIGKTVTLTPASLG